MYIFTLNNVLQTSIMKIFTIVISEEQPNKLLVSVTICNWYFVMCEHYEIEFCKRLRGLFLTRVETELILIPG